jgi:hypothetical protein
MSRQRKNESKRAAEKQEVVVCQCVADEMNARDGTDYRAELCRPDPPDVHLVSESGRYPIRGAEVVTTPQDFTIRSDNRNLQELERKLNEQLTGRGVGGSFVDVAWAKDAVRYGLKNWHHVISELATTIAEHRSNDAGKLHITKSDLLDPAVKNAVDFVSVIPLPKQYLQVDSCGGFCLPLDGRWIEEAVRKKLEKKYDEREASEWILVIDGFQYVDDEQITAFRAAHTGAQLPFAEIWIVTIFGTYRLNP